MAASPFTSPLRMRLAFRASRIVQDTFVCRRCLHQQMKQSKNHLQRNQQSCNPYKSIRQTPYLSAFRRHQSSSPPASQPTTSSQSSPLSALSQNITTSKPHPTSSPLTSTTQSSFPDTSSKPVAYWLLGSALSVFGLVVFGGLTRLTESGLSITEWKPVTGSLPPKDGAAWEQEFARYRWSPEFKMLNSRMTLEEFKRIYWMEWTHRVWGRVVGVTFLVPTVYFVVRRRVSKAMAVKLVGICGLIGFQGVVGWWMVKSGLKDDLFAPGSHPRVSQYRLAAHLGTAFVAYLAMVWNGLAILREHRLLIDPAEGMKVLETLQRPELRTFKRAVAVVGALTFITAIAGALVAGLDAGLIYNNFPWMGETWLPPTQELLDPFYSHTPNRNDLVWRNMLENPVLVQLDHRILAISTLCAVLGLWGYSRSRRIRAILPKDARKGMLGVVHLVSLQVVLGITTLWFLVPTWLGAAHQAGALALLTGVTVLGSRVWVPKRSLRLVQKALREQQRALAKRGGDTATRRIRHQADLL